MLNIGQTELTQVPDRPQELYVELMEAVRRYVPSKEEMEVDDLAYQLIAGLDYREPESESDCEEAIGLLGYLLDEHGWHEDERERQAIEGLAARAALVSPSSGRLRKSMLEQIEAFCGMEQPAVE